MGFDVAEDGGLDAAEAEEIGRSRGAAAVPVGFGLDLCEGERDGGGVAVGSQGVDPRAAGVAEAEEFGDFVEGLAGGIVDGVAYVAVVPGGVAVLRQIEVGVSAGDDEGEQRPGRGEGGGMLEQHGVDVTFEVVDGDEGLGKRGGESLGVADADEQSAGEAGAFRNGDGVELLHVCPGFAKCGIDDGDDGAEVLAGGELGDDAAVRGVDGDLGGNDIGELACAALDDSGGGFVAGALDSEDEAGSGLSNVMHQSS